MGRPILAVIFLTNLILGTRRSDAVGYWLSICFWIGFLLFLSYRTYVFGLAGDASAIGYANEAERAGGMFANAAFFALTFYMLYSLVFSEELKEYFNRL